MHQPASIRTPEQRRACFRSRRHQWGWRPVNQVPERIRMDADSTCPLGGRRQAISGPRQLHAPRQAAGLTPLARPGDGGRGACSSSRPGARRVRRPRQRLSTTLGDRLRAGPRWGGVRSHPAATVRGETITPRRHGTNPDSRPQRIRRIRRPASMRQLGHDACCPRCSRTVTAKLASTVNRSSDVLPGAAVDSWNEKQVSSRGPTSGRPSG